MKTDRPLDHRTLFHRLTRKANALDFYVVDVADFRFGIEHRRIRKFSGNYEDCLSWLNREGKMDHGRAV